MIPHEKTGTASDFEERVLAIPEELAEIGWLSPVFDMRKQ
jgi:hypothetical protein